jgi:DNA-binding SARP family transcriptional activator
VDFRILGPVEVWNDGRLLALGGRKQRALLALLLLDANEVVSTDRMIDALWGERPPEACRKLLQVYVSRLRKALEPQRAPGSSAGPLVTRIPGYLLELAHDELDLLHFRRLATEGRIALGTGDPAGASESFHAALGRWRGPALADLAYEPFFQGEADRLEEERLACLEDRIESDLALYRHGELVGELEAIVAKHPLRERPRGQLMLALYRSGRQAEALDVYQATRRALVEELGIEPSPALQALERAILRQDPELELPPALGHPQGPRSPGRMRPETRSLPRTPPLSAGTRSERSSRCSSQTSWGRPSSGRFRTQSEAGSSSSGSSTRWRTRSS